MKGIKFAVHWLFLKLQFLHSKNDAPDTNRGFVTDNMRPSKKVKLETSAHEAEIKAIYSEIERRPLARDCKLRSGCCHFRITGKTPLLTLGEALYLARGIRASGRTRIKPHPDGACPLLDRNGRCTVYTHRPFGCRTHFCETAGGMYPRKHLADLIQRLEDLDEQLRGDGSRPLVAAAVDALERLS